jgi:predicted regulator of Ras-like GTPase activity (Roadblock/LC7/MglB family)
MFGFLKNILRRPANPPASNEEPTSEMEYASPPAPPAARPAPNRQNGGRGTPAYQTQAAPGYQPGGYPNQNGGPQRPAYQNGGVKGVEVPLQKILEVLPVELQPRVRNPHVGDATISIPLDKVLSQLSRGAVRLSFGELRQAAPSVFSSETDRDRVLVQLPLNEILTQLNPALIARRRVQKQVEVPDDISSPFESQNQSSLSVSTRPMQAAKAPPPPPAPPANPFQAKPFQAPQNPYQAPQNPYQAPQNPYQPPENPFQAPQNPYQPPQNPFQPAQKPYQPPQSPYQQPAPIPFEDIPIPFQPARPQATPSPMGIPAGRNTITSTPKPQPPAAEPLISPAIAAASRSLRDFEHKAPNSIAPAPFAPEPANSGETIAVSLNAIAESWPDGIRKEIAQLNLHDAKAQLPVDAIQQGLKQGRLAFPWKTVRSWIKAPGLSFNSPQDGTVLELPLKVVAPIFMARQRAGGHEQQKVRIDNDIPNLFFGFPQADAPTEPAEPAAPHIPAAHMPAAPHVPTAPVTPQVPRAPTPPLQMPTAPRTPATSHVARTPAPPPAQAIPVAKAKDTNYYTWDDASVSAQVPQQNAIKRSPGTKFITRYATPNEVVSRAAGLEGVAGSLIALPDGLMVASQLSPDLNGDTLAAFLPQIFAKVNQCTKELRMGELNNLNFTVGNVPWKIFRVNAIFFAAFGRAGEPLPTGQLAALAAELDHKGK